MKSLIRCAFVAGISLVASTAALISAPPVPGIVLSWGFNNAGQLGNGTTQNAYQPGQAVLSIDNIAAVAAGGFHSLALRKDGTVWGWGKNSSGQLGNGCIPMMDCFDSKTPVQVQFTPNGPPLMDVLAIAAGGGHSLAITSDGKVWAWGEASSGQLGNASITATGIPKQVIANWGNVEPRGVSAGGAHSLAVFSDGSVWGWGENTSGQLGNGLAISMNVPVKSLAQKITKISAGLFHSLAMKVDGTVLAWGYNASGQLGDGSFSNTPNPTPINIGSNDPLAQRVVAISAGANHSLALKTDGTVWSWGANSQGQLGRSVNASDPTPGLIKNLGDVAAISAGGPFSLAVKREGTLWAWGRNVEGELGIPGPSNISSPQMVAGLDGITTIAAGSAHTLAAAIPTMWGWGFPGTMGNGTWLDRHTPGQVTAPTWPIQIAMGGFFSLALTQSGNVWTWGYNPINPHNEDPCESFPATGFNPLPVRVRMEDKTLLSGIDLIAAGGGHRFAVAGGYVVGWGSNKFGQLGDGATIDRCFPVFANITNVLLIAGGGEHTLAIKKDGTLWSWGSNRFGQLGIGPAPVVNTTPAKVALDNVVRVVGGDGHTFALKNDGTVWAWGQAKFGQLGDACFDALICPNRDMPHQVLGLSDVVSIAAGAVGGMALKKDGSVWVWGSNNHGQLGDGCIAPNCLNTSIPQKVPGLPPIIAIGAGSHQRFAVGSDGWLWGWGRNDYGQLGNDTTTSISVPTKILKFSSPPTMMLPLGGFSLHGLAAFIPAALPAAAPPMGGSIRTASASGAAGSTVSIPVKLEMSSGITLDMLSFALQITPNGSAPPLTGTLRFATAAGLPSPTGIDTSIGPNGIAVSWLAGSGLSLSKSGDLGSVMVTIPSSALGTQNYTIHLVAAFATSGRDSVDIALGEDNLLTVANNRPVANAGVNQTVPASAGCGASVTLDGTRSSDPDGDPLTFTWTGPFGTATGPAPAVSLRIGTHTITLTVSDGKGGTASAAVTVIVSDTTAPMTAAIQTPPNASGWNNTDVIVVLNATDDCSGVREINYVLSGAQTGAATIAGNSASVRISPEGTATLSFFARDTAGNAEPSKTLSIKIDKTPPALTCTAAPDVLWPPNRKMIPVTTGVTVADALSGPAGFTLIGASSNEPDNDAADIAGFEIGKPNTAGSLRAARSKDIARMYMLTYRGFDLAGNPAGCVAVSTVPRDNARASAPVITTLEGTLVVRHEETRAGHRYTYLLQDRNNQSELLFPVGAPGFTTGDRIRAQGLFDGNTMVVYGGSGKWGQTDALGPQPTLAILVNFKTPGKILLPFSAADVLAVMKESSDFFYENSFGQTWLTGVIDKGEAADVRGWYDVPVSLDPCDANALSLLMSNAKEKAAASGINLLAYRRFVYFFPNVNPCPFRGRAMGIGGSPSHTLINGELSRRIVTQEMGHNFGLYHSHSLECIGVVMGDDTCGVVEYGDEIEPMGNGYGHYNAFQKERLGWLNTSKSPPITTALEDGTYEIQPYASPNQGLPKALEVYFGTDVFGGTTWYYIEYRQPVGFDTYLASPDPNYPGNLTKGVILRLGTDQLGVYKVGIGPMSWGNSSLLLDMKPSSVPPGDFDWALEVGKTYTDPSGTQITLVSAGKTALVKVKYPPVMPPPPKP